MRFEIGDLVEIYFGAHGIITAKDHMPYADDDWEVLYTIFCSLDGSFISLLEGEFFLL
jgi:hypothetical protein